MKKYSIIAVLLALVLMFTACQSEKEPEGPVFRPVFPHDESINITEVFDMTKDNIISTLGLTENPSSEGHYYRDVEIDGEAYDLSVIFGGDAIVGVTYLSETNDGLYDKTAAYLDTLYIEPSESTELEKSYGYRYYDYLMFIHISGGDRVYLVIDCRFSPVE